MLAFPSRSGVSFPGCVEVPITPLNSILRRCGAATGICCTPRRGSLGNIYTIGHFVLLISSTSLHTMPKAYFRHFQFASNEQGLDIASIIGASARNLVYYRV